MKKVLTTLSLGIEYTSEYTLRLIEDVLKLSSLDIYITTNCRDTIENKFGINDRIKIRDVNLADLKIRVPIGVNKAADDFNFNMRYLCLEHVQDCNDTAIIFTDCDNSFDWWDESIIDEFLKNHIEQGYDFFGPRTSYTLQMAINTFNEHCLKDETQYQSSVLFWHKFFNYDMIEHTPLRVKDSQNHPWGPSGLPSEYLLIFYNNNYKIKELVKQWKWFHDYLINREYCWGTWAEGFEIGVSAHVAGFKAKDIGYGDPVWGKAFTPNGYKTGARAGKVYATMR
jgi:hypothetical protein